MWFSLKTKEKSVIIGLIVKMPKKMSQITFFIFSGDHGDQPSRHFGPGSVASGSLGPKNRVSVARPTSETSRLLHHHFKDEPLGRSRPRGLRRKVKKKSRVSIVNLNESQDLECAEKWTNI